MDGIHGTQTISCPTKVGQQQSSWRDNHHHRHLDHHDQHYKVSRLAIMSNPHTSAELCWCNAYGSQLCRGAMLDPSNVTKSSFLAYMYHFESIIHSNLTS